MTQYYERGCDGLSAAAQSCDTRDAERVARALAIIQDLPRVSFMGEKLWLTKLSRSRKKLVNDLNGYLNRLHIALTESYGAVCRKINRTLWTGKGLTFIEIYPTLWQATGYLAKEFHEKKNSIYWFAFNCGSDD